MINIFDIGIILLLIMFIIIGFKRGVIKELVSLVGIIIVFILSWILKGYLGNFLCLYFPFFEFKGVLKGLTSVNIFMYQTISFILIFSLLLGIYCFSLKISRIIQKIVNMTIVLWIPSKILGGIVSFIKGYLILFVVFIILLIPIGNTSLYQESSIVNIMLNKTPLLSSYTSSFTNPANDIVNLGKEVSENKISTKEADKEAIRIMIKYNVIDEQTVSKLYDKNKLDN